MNSLASSSNDVPVISHPAHSAAVVPVKWMWIAIAALGACVVALGTTLVVQHTGPVASVTSAPAVDGALPQTLAAGPARAQNTLGPIAVPSVLPAAPEPQRATLSGGTMQPARTPICQVCGQVESVQAVQQAEPATGVGAVAGGVLGAVVGNQVGKGNGRTAATVLGAVGGGYVGHQVEQRTRTRTVYQVAVRMEDGSLRRFQRSQPPAVGTPVTLEGKGYRVEQRETYRGAASTQAPSGTVRVADRY